jgi:hypothetical protein
VARAKTTGAQLLQDTEPEGGVADEQGVGRAALVEQVDRSRAAAVDRERSVGHTGRPDRGGT